MTLTASPEAKTAKYPDVRNFVAGRFTGSGQHHLEVVNPGDGSLLSWVPLSSAVDVDAAVRAAREALPAWSATPIKERVQALYRYRSLLERDFNELAGLITEEHGKIRSEAEAEVVKAIELAEFACSLPQIVPGEVLEVSRGIECRMDRYPVGVVASHRPLQLPQHGAALDHPQRYRAGQLHDPEAIGAGAAQCRAHRGASDGSGVACRRLQPGARGAGGG